MSAHDSTATQPDASQPAPPPRGGSGLAVAALITAIVSVLLCWVPYVNFAIFFLALASLGLGITALVGARRGHRDGRDPALVAVVLSVVAILGVLATVSIVFVGVDGESSSDFCTVDGKSVECEES